MGILQKMIESFRRDREQGHMADGSMAIEPPSNVFQIAGESVDAVDVAARPVAHSVPPPSKTEPRSVGVKKALLNPVGLSILDLRELPSNRFRIVGSGFWVTDSGRYKHGGSDYLVIREPENRGDINAVAVYGKGRKVGHLSEAKAPAFAPIFDELPFDGYRVAGAPPEGNSIIMRVDLPALPKLRVFAKSLPVCASSGT